ncbi:MAG TPA: DinB family protein [Chitinophagales bacterium]|nr:DinB family protein [Chitinophagales bacterium]
MSNEQLFVKMALSAWDSHVNRLNKLIDQLSDEQFNAETAPGRNSGIYLLGHLTAVNDAMLPLLGLGERMYAQLDVTFIENPDKSGQVMPSIEALKALWKNTITNLSTQMNHLTTDEWFTRHLAVSEEDFAREPHRNKLNIILNRTNHLSYHLGQLMYLKKDYSE